MENKKITTIQEAIDDAVDYTMSVIAQSANPERVEEYLDLYVNDYVRSEDGKYDTKFTDEELEEIIQKACKEYEEL